MIMLMLMRMLKVESVWGISQAMLMEGTGLLLWYYKRMSLWEEKIIAGLRRNSLVARRWFPYLWLLIFNGTLVCRRLR